MDKVSVFLSWNNYTKFGFFNYIQDIPVLLINNSHQIEASPLGMIRIPSRRSICPAVGCHVLDVSHSELKAQEATSDNSSLKIQAVELWRLDDTAFVVRSGSGTVLRLQVEFLEFTRICCPETEMDELQNCLTIQFD